MQKGNVTTVQSGIAELTEKGCISENGIEYLLDILVCATGFDTTYQTRFPIIGPGGVTLQQDWRNELKSYLGIAAAAFPNYCMTLGPYSPVGAGSVIPIIGKSFCNSRSTKQSHHLLTKFTNLLRKPSRPYPPTPQSLSNRKYPLIPSYPGRCVRFPRPHCPLHAAYRLVTKLQFPFQNSRVQGRP